jgi:hypothetical protein
VVRVDGEAELGSSLLGQTIEHDVGNLNQVPALFTDEVPMN